MRCVAVIPARISSTRIKEKPLVNLGGKPLIQWVYEKAVKLRNVDDVVVATDSEKIAETVKKFKGKFKLTPTELLSGSDRVYYTSNRYFRDASLIVNIQGDEPFIDAGFIDLLIEQAKKGQVGLYSAYFPVSKEIAKDVSIVKVVVNKDHEALYFSRSMVPSDASVYKKHLGIYVWKKELLEKFYNSTPTLLERTEKLEQLRVLENGDKIKMVESPMDSIGIDTPQDLEKARERLKEVGSEDWETMRLGD